MQPVIYDVAVSLDGFICGVGGDVSRFAVDGPVVDDYRARLKTYAVAVMGRRTYEFGYRYGLLPGQNPYSHMRTFVVSSTLAVPEDADIAVVETIDELELSRLTAASDGPVYLCGGGEFAAALLSAGHIDRLRLKRAPAFFGDGVRLFGRYNGSVSLEHIETKRYDGGYFFQEFLIH